MDDVEKLTLEYFMRALHLSRKTKKARSDVLRLDVLHLMYLKFPDITIFTSLATITIELYRRE